MASKVYHKSSNLYVGTSKKNPTVTSIISKAINSIPLRDITKLRQKWFDVTIVGHHVQPCNHAFIYFHFIC